MNFLSAIGPPGATSWDPVCLGWLARLFDMMAVGFLPISIYVLLVAGRFGPTLPGTRVADFAKVGANAPCPCGSGFKLKNRCRT